MGDVTVQVLISTYNGDRYLREQLDSVINQVGVHPRILVRDDGSTDTTHIILDGYKRVGLLDFYVGENIKSAKSFMDLLFRAPDSEYYAFCDQDDFWLPEKLVRAIDTFQKDEHTPNLYFSKTTLATESLAILGYEKSPTRVLSLGEALVRNNASGCTMVFNRELAQIIKRHYPRIISMHDHWVYLVCLAIGGRVFFDDTSHILYRQHQSNVVGGRKSFAKTYISRMRMLISRERTRSLIANELLEGYQDYMKAEEVDLLEKILFYQNSWKEKKNLLFERRIKSNDLWHNAMLNIAIIFDAF